MSFPVYEPGDLREARAITALREGVAQGGQGLFALVADDGVDLREGAEDLVVGEGREVAARGDVAPEAVAPEVARMAPLLPRRASGSGSPHAVRRAARGGKRQGPASPLPRARRASRVPALRRGPGQGTGGGAEAMRLGARTRIG